MLNRGMPGAGGISTQAAELCALGAKYIVHIGTCGLVSTHLTQGKPIISNGAYKDAVAMMLTNAVEGSVDRFARPSTALTDAIHEDLSRRGLEPQRGRGYTMPVFYLRPARLMIALAEGSVFGREEPVEYCEMEQAPFFQTCALMNAHAASVVVGSDRYLVEAGNLEHEYYDVDDDTVKSNIFAAVLETFKRLA